MNYADINTLVHDVLRRMHITPDNVTVEDSDGRVRVVITLSSESQTLIGAHGTTLTALNHIIKRISAQKGYTEPFTVDVNNYYEAGLDTVRNKARISAERARSYKTNIEMEPMNSYERMVVHSTLADESSVATESAGHGKDRRVVIRYIEETKNEL